MNPVIILGMHRSGTSLIAEVFHEIGIFMGNDLNSHYESKVIKDINDNILSAAHGSWDYPLPIEKLIMNRLSYNNVVRDLKNKLNKKKFLVEFWGTRNLFLKKHKKIKWGWKDPRTTITFPFWLKIWPDAKVIFIYRNGVDVADSLFRREKKREGIISSKAYSLRNLDINEAFKLWDEYNSIFLKYKHLIKNRNLLSFSYESFLEDPLRILELVKKFLMVNFSNGEFAISKINSKNQNKFLRDKNLIGLYNRVKSNKTMKKYHYDSLISND
jgi:hypothetical protein